MGVNAANFMNAALREHATLYADDRDRNKHRAYIAAIAQEEHKAFSEVADCYEHILANLRGQARVHDYLNIFVAKRVLELLKARQ